MEVSGILSVVTTVTPTGSSKAFQDWLLSRWCDVLPLHRWREGEGVKEEKIQQIMPPPQVLPGWQ